MWDALVGEELPYLHRCQLFQNQYRDMVDHTHLLQPHPLLYDAQSKEQKEILKFDDVICFGVQNCAECRARNKASGLTGHLVAMFLTQGLLVHYVPTNNIFDLTHSNFVRNLSDDRLLL